VVISDGVKVLVKKNLVKKLKPSDNKRAYYLHVSPIGKQTIDISLPAVKKFDQEFFNT